MPIRELIKEYRGRIWQEAYCHPFSDSNKSDSVLEKIESELKELEEKAEAFDYMESEIRSTGEAKAILNETGDGGYSCGQTWVSLGFGGTTNQDFIYRGSDLLECVRKARGEE